MTITIPTRADELEEFLGDPAKVSALFNSNGTATPQFGEFVKNYADSRRTRDETIAQQIEEQVQASLATMLRDQHGGTGRVNLGRRGDSTAAASAPGARLNDVFVNHGEFLQACYPKRDSLPNAADLRDKVAKLIEVQNSYGTTIPGDGGYLVPESFRQDIMTLSLESGITRPRATVIPMSGASLTIPAVDDTTHASETTFGGVTVYWTSEAGSLTETQAKFARVKLEAEKLTAFSLVPNELPADAPAFLAWFMARMPQAVAWKEDMGFINGTGVGQPLGWLNSPAAISVTKETNQTADTIVWQNIIKAYSRMLPTSLGSAVWVANIDTLPELATMALSVGTGGSAVWLNNGVDGPPARILGRPVFFTEKVPTVGDAGDINFVDLSYYAIGDRQTMRLESSTDFKFQNDETAFRLIERVDGRPMLLSALTPAKSSSTLSAFVKVAARA